MRMGFCTFGQIARHAVAQANDKALARNTTCQEIAGLHCRQNVNARGHSRICIVFIAGTCALVLYSLYTYALVLYV